MKLNKIFMKTRSVVFFYQISLLITFFSILKCDNEDAGNDDEPSQELLTQDLRPNVINQDNTNPDNANPTNENNIGSTTDTDNMAPSNESTSDIVTDTQTPESSVVNNPVEEEPKPSDDVWIEKLEVPQESIDGKQIGPYFNENKKTLLDDSLKIMTTQSEIKNMNGLSSEFVGQIVSQTGCGMWSYLIFSICNKNTELTKEAYITEIENFFKAKNGITLTGDDILNNINKKYGTNLTFNQMFLTVFSMAKNNLNLPENISKIFEQSFKSGTPSEFLRNFAIDFFSINGLLPDSLSKYYKLKHVVIEKEENLYKYINSKLLKNEAIIICGEGGDHYTTIVGYDDTSKEYILLDNDKNYHRQQKGNLKAYFAPIKSEFTPENIEELVGNDENAQTLFEITKNSILLMLVSNYKPEEHFHYFPNIIAYPQYKDGKKGNFVVLSSNE